MTPEQMLEKRAGLIKQARELHDKAEAEKRAFSAEDKAAFDRIMSEADGLKTSAERAKSLADAEAAVAAAQERRTTPDPTTPTADPKPAAPTDTESRAAFHKWLRNPHEARAGSPHTKVDAEGGYYAPTLTVRDVIKRMEHDSFLMKAARRIPIVGAKAASIPTVTTAMTAPAHGADGSETTKDSAFVLGETKLTPVKLSALASVTEALIEESGSLAEAELVDQASQYMREQAEAAYVAGTGSGQPLGVFNESSALTTREVQGATATDFDFDDLVKWYFSVKPPYRRNAAWLASGEFFRRAMTLKDGDGRPLWLPSLTTDKPDTLMGRPAWESEFASATFTTDKRIAVFGDFNKGYVIGMSIDMRIKRLVERYAEFDAVGFLFVAYHDAKIRDANALVACHTG